MKTRTLLLLSVGVGLLILLAGGVKLLQVATDRTEVRVLDLGESAVIGDMTVAVTSVSQDADGTLVEISMSGVAGAAVIEDWRLLGDGSVIEATGASSDDRFCSSRTLVPEGGSPARCTLRFAAVETVQAVAYTRAGEQRQWAP
ncbi:MAG: hypothetical protein ACKOA6_13060 [Actinomycetota bacterium]